MCRGESNHLMFIVLQNQKNYTCEGSGWNAIPTIAMPRDASLAFNVGLTTSFCIITLPEPSTSSSSEHGAPTDPTDDEEEEVMFNLNPGLRAQAGSYGPAERSRTLKSKV